MHKRPWADFSNVRSTSFVPDLLSDARVVAPADLVDMRQHRQSERIAACNGIDPLATLVVYAQDGLIYDTDGHIVPTASQAEYLATLRHGRVNKFGLAYRSDATLWLHKTLADIVVGAAMHLHQTQGWSMVLYDGLRTVEGAYNLYLHAPPSDMESGLLSLPGRSAHNKGLAIDSMFYDRSGCEIDMGGHFDHLDMATNSRTYNGDGISEAARCNRLLREAAFLRSAFSQGLLIAPLRTEFWDDRLPENRADLWRVLDSAARCLGLSLLTPQDESLRKTDRTAFAKKWERWSYGDFLARWQATFKGREAALQQLLGAPPPQEKPEFYHGNYHPIYDRDLRESGKHLT
jgi:D-alanyl-D-alanine dipeptidase